MNKSIFNYKILYKFFGAIIIGIFVDIIVRSFTASKSTETLSVFYKLIISGDLVNDISITLKRFAFGFSLAVITAVPSGLIIGTFRRLYLTLEIPIEMLRPIPSAVIIPFGLVALGVGDTMKLFVIWFGAFWPLFMYTLVAAQNIEPIKFEIAKVYRISFLKKLFLIILPSIVPQIIAGMRSSISIALLLAVTVEMIAGGRPEGIGYFIIDSERSFRHDLMISGVIALSIVGYGINFIFVKIEGVLTKKRYGYLNKVEK